MRELALFLGVVAICILVTLAFVGCAALIVRVTQ